MLFSYWFKFQSLALSIHCQVPSEFKISEKWDVCLERTVINFGMGVVAAGLAGVVLTRECYSMAICLAAARFAHRGRLFE